MTPIALVDLKAYPETIGARRQMQTFMSAFEGTWLDFALRDSGINAFIIVGVATEIGIEPTARQGADLGYILVVVSDACGAGNVEAAKRSIESLKFAGDALVTDTKTICDVLRKQSAPGNA